MIRSGEEILSDIDLTLDQLIKNAATIQSISFDALLANEIEALQKTQESLLARLFHMNNLIDADEKRAYYCKLPTVYTSIEEKIDRFSRLNAELIKQIRNEMRSGKKKGKNPIRIRKNRKRIKVPC